MAPNPRRPLDGTGGSVKNLRLTCCSGAMVRDEDNPVNVAKKMEGAREKAS